MAIHERIKGERQKEVDNKRRLKKGNQLQYSQPKAPRREGLVPSVYTPFLPSLEKHAALLTVTHSDKHRANLIIRLQQTYGNTYVQRLVNSINNARSSGQPLPTSVRESLEPYFRHDFSDVRIHNDAQSDRLSRQLGAEAFTTGKDIFFREGTYQPDSERGKGLIAHELTHVVQQTPISPIDASVELTTPCDKYEQEAEVAERSIRSGEPVALPRQKAGAALIAGRWTEPRNISPEWNEYDRLRTLLERQYPDMRWEVVEEDRWGPRRWRVWVVPWASPEELTRANVLQWMRRRVLGPAPPRAEETAPVSPYW